MTCEDLQLLRGIHMRMAMTTNISKREERDAFYSLNQTLQTYRHMHEQTGCLCWYRQLRAEGKYIIPEIAVRLDAAA